MKETVFAAVALQSRCLENSQWERKAAQTADETWFIKLYGAQNMIMCLYRQSGANGLLHGKSLDLPPGLYIPAIKVCAVLMSAWPGETKPGNCLFNNT